MSSSFTTFSSPSLRRFSTTQVATSTTKAQVLTPPANITTRRIVLLVQNTSTTDTVQLMGNATDTVGVVLPPQSQFSLDNYNGGLWAVADSGTPSINITIGSV
jgi:hypothetical protein